MDNLDNMIQSALRCEYEPDATLLRETINTCATADRHKSKLCLHAIFAYALCAITALMLCVHYVVRFTPYITFFQPVVYLYCLSWICTLLPAYILAYKKFTKGCI